MVARAALAALALTALVPAAAITPAALHALARRDEQAERLRARFVRPGDLAALAPPAPRPRSAPRVSATARRHAGRRHVVLHVRDVPRDPLWAGSPQAVIYSDAVAPDRRHPFGIRLGTWMHARLPTRASSADPGRVELVLSRTVHGRYRRLPAGTLLFCVKRLSGATQRMEMIAVQGITPGGREFRLRGRVFDTARVPGLAGVVTVDAVRMLRRSAGQGVLAAGGTAVGSLLGGTGAAAAAAGAATGSLFSDAGRAISGATRRMRLIDVAPQPVLIRVEATF